MPDDDPRVEQELRADAAVLTLRGDWTANHTARLEALSAQAPANVPHLTIDMRGVRRLDSFGAWAVETLRQNASEAGARADVIEPRHEGVAILSQIRDAHAARPAVRRRHALDLVEATGRGVEGAILESVSVVSMIGRLALSLFANIRRPELSRFRSTVHHMDRVGVRAVPIIALITFLIGCIIAQQGLFYFRKFGAADYVVNLVVILVLREIGVLLVTIMVAGRSGSSYAAELGSMKMREEIDALRTMGLDPVDLLVLPRVVALVLTLPMLTLLGVFSALVGAGLVVWASGDMSPPIYLAHLREAATYADFEVGMIKAPIMALIIGIVAAIEGLKIKESAESLGLGVTASVVKAIFLVIVLDGLFAVVFTSLGM